MFFENDVDQGNRAVSINKRHFQRLGVNFSEESSQREFTDGCCHRNGVQILVPTMLSWMWPSAGVKIQLLKKFSYWPRWWWIQVTVDHLKWCVRARTFCIWRAAAGLRRCGEGSRCWRNRIERFDTETQWVPLLDQWADKQIEQLFYVSDKEYGDAWSLQYSFTLEFHRTCHSKRVYQ